MSKLIFKLIYAVTVIIVLTLLAYSLYQVYAHIRDIIILIKIKKFDMLLFGDLCIYIWSTYSIYGFLVGMHVSYINNIYEQDEATQRKEVGNYPPKPKVK